MSRSPKRALSAAICLLLWTACTTAPTLPLPPPVATVGYPSAKGLVRVEGQVQADADVFVYNDHAESGVIGRADAEGLYSMQVAAESGDRLLVWSRVGTQESERTERTVPFPPPGADGGP